MSLNLIKNDNFVSGKIMPWKLSDQRINKQDSESDYSTQLQLVPKHTEVNTLMIKKKNIIVFKKLCESNSWK